MGGDLTLWLILVAFSLSNTLANEEVDALYIFRNTLQDPKNVMYNWNHTAENPCLWNFVTCNNINSVIRLDLGNASLTGQLVPQLGLLTNLQYLELYGNNLSGHIPVDLGNLTNLVSLDLYFNNFDGPIPDSLGKLLKLRFLRLNNNKLSGSIPMSLTTIVSLQSLDLSNNRLSGPVPSNGSFSLFTAFSYVNNLDLCGPITGKLCPGSSPPPAVSSPNVSGYGTPNIGATARGVAAALIFVILAI